jgi:hypothetical protein
LDVHFIQRAKSVVPTIRIFLQVLVAMSRYSVAPLQVASHSVWVTQAGSHEVALQSLATVGVHFPPHIWGLVVGWHLLPRITSVRVTWLQDEYFWPAARTVQLYAAIAPGANQIAETSAIKIAKMLFLISAPILPQNPVE